MTTVTDFGIDFTHIGPAVGERFPDVVLPDQSGQPVHLHQARGQQRALIVFHRSAAWWPFCKTQLVELQRTLPDFTRANIRLFAISYDSVDVLRGFADKHGITYFLLADEGSVAIRSLGLLNEEVYDQHAAYGIPKQDRHWGVPYPGVFLLDEKGDVVQKRFHQSYRERETGVGILEQGFGEHSTLARPQDTAQAADIQVTASLDSERYRFFQRLWLTVELAIPPGLHIYTEPIPDGYIPLSIDVAPIPGMVVGEPQCPASKPFQVADLEEQFQVYTGNVKVALPVTLTEEGDDQSLHITVRYQSCSDTDCLVPSTVNLALPIQADDHIERPRRK